ncbi:MAG: TrbI/VirB10 family protein [Rhizobiaceae bacterium]
MTADRDDKIDPEQLELRARPRPVTRISRKALYAGSALALILIAGAVLVALDPPNWQNGPRKELLETHSKQTPDGLEKLPSSYDDIPELGSPNPGDLGKTITRLERELGIRPEVRQSLPTYRPDPEAEFERAERIRLARKAAQARESDLFFAVRTKQVELQARDDAKPGDRFTKPSPQPDLAALRALAALPSLGDSDAASSDPNDQKAKLAFLKQGPAEVIYNEHGEQKPVSPFQLMAGTIIPASLVTGLNSDLPGFVIAQVTENVFDSLTGRYLLIPQGSRLIGRYDSVTAFGQSRALVVWQRIIRPDGASMVIDNLPATDEAGYAGLSDKVDFHTWELIKGIAMSTLLGVGTELNLGTSESDLVQAIRESAQENVNRVGQSIVQRTLDIQPTITVRPGWPLRVIVNKDITLSPYRSGAR